MTLAPEASDLPQEICERYLFEPENEQTFSYVVASAASSYVDACETVNRYVQEHSPEARESLKRHVRALPEFQGIVDELGDDADDFIEAVAIAPIPKEVVHNTRIALIQRTEAADRLAKLAAGCQAVIKEGALGSISVDENEADQIAWTATWMRFRSTLQPMGGSVLSDVADLFDSMVALEYPQTYDHRDQERGAEARADLAARTFYEVMRPHLTRTVLPRLDYWSGK